MRRTIPISEPNLGERERELVNEAVAASAIATHGSHLPEFERRFAAFVGADYAATCSSGTTALHLALEAFGIGPGDEVIVPNLTFIATANAATYVGAKAVLVDIDPVRWNIDPAAIEAAITARTKAIIPVHIYGRPANMDAIMSIARSRKLVVIEDAAEALGTRHYGTHVGTIGHAGCFSFYANKLITTGEGGMVVSNDREFIERVNLLKAHGMSPTRRYYHPVVGFNFRLTNMQAALGVAQMERVCEFVSRKQRTLQHYVEGLEDLPGFTMPPVMPGHSDSAWLSTFAIDPDFAGLDRDQLAAELGRAGVETRPVFIPLSEMPPYRRSAHLFPVSTKASAQGLSLPSGTGISDEDVAYVVGQVRAAVLRRVKLHPRVLAKPEPVRLDRAS